MGECPELTVDERRCLAFYFTLTTDNKVNELLLLVLVDFRVALETEVAGPGADPSVQAVNPQVTF